MKLQLTIIICTLAIISVAQTPLTQNGTIKFIKSFQSDYIPGRSVVIWTPESYSKSNTPYNVLYMYDGQMLFDSTTTWNGQEWDVDGTLSKLLQEGKIQNTMVVGIYNGGPERRTIEYFPEKGFKNLSPDEKDYVIAELRKKQQFRGVEKPDSDNYLRFIVEEIKPWVDKNYNTNPTQKHTFIAGSSYGGLMSLYAICEYPEVFGGAACLSTHWTGLYDKENNPVPDALFEYFGDNLPSPENHKIYFDYGTETLDALYEPHQLRMNKIMERKGYNEVNFLCKKFPGHLHDERSWKSRFHIPVMFLFGNE